MKTLPTKTLAIRQGAEEVLARPATEDDWPGIVEMHFTAPDMPWARPPEEMSPEERAEYGGPWMSIETLKPYYAVYVERGSPILVAEDNSGRIVANIDLWLADEPEPVGRNAFVEIVQEDAEYLGSGLENAFLGYAAEVARVFGYEALDGSFGIGGLSDDYSAKRAMGFRIWDEHDRLEIACNPGPIADMVDLAAAGEAIQDLVVLGRWAPTEYVWLLGRAGEPDEHRFGVQAAGQRCVIHGQQVKPAGTEGRPEATFYLPADRRHDAALVGELCRIYSAFGARLGLDSFDCWVPSAVTDGLSGIEVKSARYAGTCLRMRL